MFLFASKMLRKMKVITILWFNEERNLPQRNWMKLISVLFQQIKCNENYLSLGFANVNNLPYCVFSERAFLNSVMAQWSCNVMWRPNIHSLKAKGIENLNAGVVSTLNTKNCFHNFPNQEWKSHSNISQTTLLYCYNI